MSVYGYMDVDRFCQRPKKGNEIDRWLWVIQHRFCEPNSGPLQEKHTVLINELSLQPHIWISDIFINYLKILYIIFWFYSFPPILHEFMPNLPSLPPKTQHVLLIFFKPIQYKHCCLECVVIGWLLVNLPGATLVKVSNSPVLRTYQLLIATHLGVRLWDHLSASMVEFFLSWACWGLIYAITTTVSSNVQMSDCA